MKSIIKTLAISLISIFMMSGCKASNEEVTKVIPEPSVQKEATYIKISPKEAKEIMDTEKDIIILDVRTQEEYDIGHIENAILIPNTEIGDQAEDILKDKNQKILVYCRSGSRSKTASIELIDMGYTEIYDFGGIIDWPY